MPSFKFIFGMAAVALPCLLPGALYAAPINPEDAPIEDEPITQENAPPAALPSTIGSTPDSAPAENTPVTITKSQWEQMLARQQQLEAELALLKGQVSLSPSAPASEDEILDADVDLSGGTTRSGSANRSLLLPDISLIVNSNFNATNDRRDEDRNRFRLNEAEIGIQGYVYPNIKVDAFLVAAPGEGEAFNVEEAYLTFIGLRKNLNLIAGRKFAPFGRTGEQHPHSWLYSRQLIPKKNLVADENLVGDGLLARYLLPTGKNLFANLDVGIWNAAEGEEGEILNAPDQIIGGPGASFTDRYYTARLWASKAIGRNNELELGASWAQGDSALVDNDVAVSAEGKAQISGLDFTLRRFFSGSKRLLVRGEYFRYNPKGGLREIANSANGYYLLGNYRLNNRDDIGLLLENSGFPGNSEREKALSLIFTRQLTEQFYLRLHGTRGDRPGGSYNQVIAQMVFGIGPHTHELE